jgi:cytoskeletal protein CcmA (bactofilin family)
MFGNKRPDTPSGSDTTPTADTSVAKPADKPVERRLSEIAEGLSIVGEMSGEGDVRLNGRFEGNIRCRALTIGKTGELVGRVTAQEVDVHGTVRGDIRATQVTLASSATVLGDVQHDVLEVAAGARIEGRYTHGLAKRDMQRPAVDVAKDPPPRAPQRPLAKPGNGAATTAAAPTAAPSQRASSVGASSGSDA